MNQLLTELRRRNVFRVAAAYPVVGWIVMQVVATIGGAAGLPDWADSFALIILVAGFPVVLFIAWAFELTPDGMKKTEASDESAGFKPLGPSDYVLIAAMLVVLGVVGFQTLGQSGDDQSVANLESVETSLDEANSPNVPESPVVEAETTVAPVSEASIAVLPFADFSPDRDQQYFSDGIAEELLNALAQFPDLRVAARTSAFSFRGDDVDLREVGDALGVAHVLEGSVRQSGDRLRITAQLIRTSDGYHLWSETYERTMTDVFEIQDDIVSEISRVLQTRLGVGGGAGRAGNMSINPQAYEQYLRGLSFWAERANDGNRRAAIAAFGQATSYDPDFADGWAAYGVSLALSHMDDTGIENVTMLGMAQNALDRALELDPENARAFAGLAWLNDDANIELATGFAQRAVEIAPNAVFAQYALANVMIWRGENQASRRAFEQAISLDPLSDILKMNYRFALRDIGDITAYETLADQCAVCLTRSDFRYSLFQTALHGGTEAQISEQLESLPEAIVLLQRDQPDFDTSQLFGAMVSYVDMVLGVEGAGTGMVGLVNSDIPYWEAVFVLAAFGEVDQAAELSFRTRNGGDNRDLLLHLNEGRLEFPEALRRHPRYHEFWALPGMLELADTRRANGVTAGLPLPVEASE